MKTEPRIPGRTWIINHVAAPTAGISILIALSLIWNLNRVHREIDELTLVTARQTVDKDLLYRRWNTSHGGVYVPVTPMTQPNPYLNVPERDITTPSGRQLTLINPAYMTRQVYEFSARDAAIRGHLTSLRPLRPQNAPSPWEEQALKRFEQGEREIYAFGTADDTTEVLRYARAFITESGCLRCHASQGYKVGDIRGGISIEIPTASYQAALVSTFRWTWATHGIVWIAALGFIALTARRRLKYESLLTTREYFFRTVADYTFDWEYWRAPDGSYLYVSPSCTRITGYAPEEFTANPLLMESILHPADRERMANHLRSIDVEGTDYEDEFRILHKDGTERWIGHKCRPVHDAGGRYAGRRVSNRDITARKHAEQARLEREAHYHAVIATTPDGFWIVSPDGRLLDVNDSYVRRSGYTREELLTMHISDLEAQESSADTEQHIHTILGTGNDLFESVHRTKDGSLWQVEVNVAYSETAGDRLYVFIRDIRRRKRSDLLLRTRMELSMLAQTSTLDTLIQTALDDAELLTGSTIGFFHFVDEDQNSLRLQTWSTNTLNNMCKAEGKGRHYPVADAGVWVDCLRMRKPVIHNDYASLSHKKGLPEGHAPVVRELTVPIIREGLVTAIMGVGNKTTDYGQDDVDIVHDLAALVMDTIHIKHAQEELRENRAQLQTIIDNFPFLVWLKDSSGRFMAVNKPFAESCGMASPAEVAGKNDYDIWPGPLAERYRADDTDVMSKAQVKVVEERIRDRDAEKWFETFKAPLFNEQGIVVGTTGFARDITDRKRSEEERISLERRLLHAQKLESLGVLAGGIAHDFNNLLTAIVGNLDMALTLSPASQARTHIDRALLATRRAAHLTGEMLDYSGRGHFVMTPVNLGELVTENTEFFRTSIARTISLNLDVTKEHAVIEADKGQMQQIIMNLITNAAEAIGEKPGTITLTTGIMECTPFYLSRSRLDEKPAPGRFVYVEVSDTGHGMSPETQQRLFEPFFTTKFTGRGLGMSAVLGIVRGHNGAIIVDSTEGVGTTIRVLFPEMPGGTAPAAPALLDMKAPSVTPGEHSAILIVDDEEFVRELCVEFVRHLGLTVLEAGNGSEALDVFRQHHETIACVILDLTMPHMDGIATFEHMRAFRPDVRVILSSGFDERDIMQRYHQTGFAGFLQKPYRLEQLKQKLAEVLQ